MNQRADFSLSRRRPFSSRIPESDMNVQGATGKSTAPKKPARKTTTTSAKSSTSQKRNLNAAQVLIGDPKPQQRSPLASVQRNANRAEARGNRADEGTSGLRQPM